jgi:hypothetical protein
VPVDPTGVAGPTRGQARGPGWRRSTRGFYVPSTAGDLPEQRILEQSMRLAAVGAVTGWAACRLHGAAFFDGLAPDGVTRLPVPLAVGPGGTLRAVDGVLLTFDRIPAHDVVRRQGIPVVDATRAVFDAARLADGVREAVVAIDMAIVGGITSAERVAAYTRGHHDQGITGIGQVREALPLVRERSWSPNESRLRLMGEIDAGLPRLEPNCPVLDRQGNLLGIVDLLEPAAGLALEFDGADHRDRIRHTRDVAKDEAFRSHGLEVTRITGTDLRDRDLVVNRLLAARSRARFEPADVRRWVAAPVPDSAEAELCEREAWAELYAAQERASLAAEHPDSAFRA